MARVVIWQRAGGGAFHRGSPFFLDVVVRTLEAGFGAAANLNVSRGLGFSNDFREVIAALVQGDAFVFVGMWNEQVPWKALGKRGVRRVLYQTEPLHGHNCSGVPMSRWSRIDEYWDFSEHNLEDCRARKFGVGAQAAARMLQMPTWRLVPPGAVGPPPAEADILRNHNLSTTLLFFGNAKEPRRWPCYHELRSQLPLGSLHWRFDVFDQTTFQTGVLDRCACVHRDRGVCVSTHPRSRYASLAAPPDFRVLGHPHQTLCCMLPCRYGIFLNLHKVCGDAHNPVTFRAAALMSAGKLLLSEHAHPADEAAYRNMIIFASDLKVAYTRLLADGDWRMRAAAASRAFRRRFDPRVLFERAGVYRDWQLQLKPYSV